MADAAAPVRLTFHAVDKRRWPDLERLFGGRGGPKNCWCMVWRADPDERRLAAQASGKVPAAGQPAPSSLLRKAALQRRVEAGTPVGLIGYDGDEPVAWVSVAPRPTYRRLNGPDDHQDDPDSVWSLVCFYVRRALRRQGIMRQLIDAAADHARHHGARVLEAYPVDAGASSYRFMGFVPVFEEAGFDAVGKAGSLRTVMRRDLR